eukprot:725987-Rhodomonas_salina.1
MGGGTKRTFPEKCRHCAAIPETSAQCRHFSSLFLSFVGSVLDLLSPIARVVLLLCTGQDVKLLELYGLFSLPSQVWYT